MTDTRPADEPTDKSLEILNVRSEIVKRQSRATTAIDRIGHTLAQPWLFVALLAAHLLWIVLNLPGFAWFEPWDPYPFTFLATIASAEAPFLALLIMMYQRHSSRISELREELDLQVALHLERQSTMLVRLVRELQEAGGNATAESRELIDSFEQELDARRLMDNVRRELDRKAE